VVININNVINKDIPSVAMAAGIALKIRRKNYLSREVSPEQLEAQVLDILSYWSKILVPNKQITILDSVSYNEQTNIVSLIQPNGETYCDANAKTISGYIDAVSEDLRDYLRRRGLKIFSGKLFKSLPIK